MDTRTDHYGFYIGMPGTAKNELNNVQEEFNGTWEARKVSHMCLAEHMLMICDMGQICTRGESLTRDLKRQELN